MNTSSKTSASEGNHAGLTPTKLIELRIGMYVDLNCSWFKHPFASKTFKITTEKELAIIRGLGLSSVLVDPALSDCEKSEQASSDVGKTVAPDFSDKSSQNTESSHSAPHSPMVIHYQESLQQADALYKQAVAESARTLDDIRNGSQAGLAAAKQMVDGLTELLATDDASSAMGSLLGTQELDDIGVLHAMNVAVLSMLVGRQFDLGHEAMRALGIAGFLHDIGDRDLPSDLRHKTWDNLKSGDRRLVQQHVDLGLHKLAQFPGIPDEVTDIIRHHHERVDGSGYPSQLKGSQLSLPLRILMVVDEYETLVNAPDIQNTMTPTETLSKLYLSAKTKFSEEVVVGLIQTLSVYPPGTVVALNDHSIGLVVSINLHSRMRPLIVLYDPAIDRANPNIADLSKNRGLSIVRSIPRSELPQETSDYLNLTRWTGFFISSSLKTLEEERVA
ncbi:MAG: DUF3391 domain-containing protein [Nitrospira sp.]|nr:DUF3391 domain-containing protein [Nitrospira sp.]